MCRWQQPPLTDRLALDHLKTQWARGRLRDSAVAVVHFDPSWREDTDSLRLLRPLAAWVDIISFNESAQCEAARAATLTAKRKVSHGWKCTRAHGKFIVAGIPLASLPPSW